MCFFARASLRHELSNAACGMPQSNRVLSANYIIAPVVDIICVIRNQEGVDNYGGVNYS